jgi:hypothetical protein
MIRNVWLPRIAAVALALALPIAAVGLNTAAMQLPADFAPTAVRLPVDGYGGANRGRFSIDRYSGQFTRIESRLAVFDPVYASNRGSASFTLEGPDLGGSISAECRFKQNVVTAGIVTFDPKKFAFVCDIEGSELLPDGQLTLGEPRPEGLRQRLAARASRRGLAEFGSIEIEIESVHQYAESRIVAPTPVGYLLSVDSVVGGALELTDINPTIFVADSLDEQNRLAILTAAIAVSLLRDPANSTLGE